MFTKAQIYNLALGALLLQREISDPTTDKSNEAKVLNTHYDMAFRTAIEEMDLDATSSQLTLELLETDPADFPEWRYVYKYPASCAFFRRIKSTSVMDNRTTHIPKKIGMRGGVKVIFTNESLAIAECVEWNLTITALSATAAMAVAYRLAILASPLIVGKGAAALRVELGQRYVAAKAEAQGQDKRENFNFTDPSVESEFVEERLS